MKIRVLNTVEIDHDELESFKQSWPCHNIPDAIHHIEFTFELPSEDLVDIVYYNAMNRQVNYPSDYLTDAGPALVALSKDAQDKIRVSVE